MTAKFDEKTQSPLLRTVAPADSEFATLQFDFSMEVAISGLEDEKKFKEYLAIVVHGHLILVRAKICSQLPHHVVAVPLGSVSCEMFQRADHCIKIRPMEGSSSALKSLSNPSETISLSQELVIRTLDTCRGQDEEGDRLFFLFAALAESQGTRAKSVEASLYIKPDEAKVLIDELLENIQKTVPGKSDEKFRRKNVIKAVSELVFTEFRYLDGYTEFHSKLLQLWGMVVTRDKSESKAFAEDLRTLVLHSRRTMMTALTLRNEFAQVLLQLHQLMKDDGDCIMQMLDAVMHCAMAMNAPELVFVKEAAKRQKMAVSIRQSSPLLSEALEVLDNRGSPDRRFDDLFILAVQRLTRRNTCIKEVIKHYGDVVILSDAHREHIDFLSQGFAKLVDGANQCMHEEERDMERIAKELKGAVNVLDPNRRCLFRAKASFTIPERLGGSASSVDVFIFNDSVVLAKPADTKVGGLVLSYVYDLRPGSKTASGWWSAQRLTEEGTLVVKVDDEYVDEVKFLPNESESIRRAIAEARASAPGTKNLIQREIRRSASSLVVRAVASPARLLRAASVGRSSSTATPAAQATPRAVHQAPPAALARATQLHNTPGKAVVPITPLKESQNAPPNTAHVSREAAHPKMQVSAIPRQAVTTPSRLAPGPALARAPAQLVRAPTPQQVRIPVQQQ